MIGVAADDLPAIALPVPSDLGAVQARNEIHHGLWRCTAISQRRGWWLKRRRSRTGNTLLNNNFTCVGGRRNWDIVSRLGARLATARKAGAGAGPVPCIANRLVEDLPLIHI